MDCGAGIHSLSPLFCSPGILLSSVFLSHSFFSSFKHPVIMSFVLIPVQSRVRSTEGFHFLPAMRSCQQRDTPTHKLLYICAHTLLWLHVYLMHVLWLQFNILKMLYFKHACHEGKYHSLLKHFQTVKTETDTIRNQLYKANLNRFGVSLRNREIFHVL